MGIHKLDIKDEPVGLSHVENIQRSNLWADLWKSRSKWLKDGDSNSKYFHILVNCRRRSNFIQRLRINDDWVEDVACVGDGVHSHFHILFSERLRHHHTLHGV
ncbi:hypothetical protein Lal_00018949, partial [Lupinus albus]